jgi:hypothetical protein
MMPCDAARVATPGLALVKADRTRSEPYAEPTEMVAPLGSEKAMIIPFRND